MSSCWKQGAYQICDCWVFGCAFPPYVNCIIVMVQLLLKCRQVSRPQNFLYIVSDKLAQGNQIGWNVDQNLGVMAVSSI